MGTQAHLAGAARGEPHLGEELPLVTPSSRKQWWLSLWKQVCAWEATVTRRKTGSVGFMSQSVQ